MSVRKRRAKRGWIPHEQVTIELTDMAYEGHAIGRNDNEVVFAEYGIPGEEAVVELYKRQPGYANGRVIEVTQPSPDRVEPRCPYFGNCGGCHWQHIGYERQLELKRHVVAEQLRRIGKFAEQPVSPTVSADDPWGYRNHLRMSAGRRGDIGFVRRGSHSFLQVESCAIARPEINDAIAKLQGKASGLHQVEFRLGTNTGDLLVEPDMSAREASMPAARGSYIDTLLGRRFQESPRASSMFATFAHARTRISPNATASGANAK